jgi:GntR family transcriptional repressor for pyruvate dehydrogenase complex
MREGKREQKPLPLLPPRRVTVVDSIIEQLVSLIQRGELKPGDKLPSERRLMEMLGVSRSSVREALQSLAAMGLVEGRAGEGTFIKQPKPQFDFGMDIASLSTALQKEMRLHLLQARFLLEKEIVLLAAQNITDEHRRALNGALAEYLAVDQLAEYAAAMEGRPTGSSHDRIHLTIAESTGNPILVQLLKTLLDMVPKTLRLRGFLEGPPEQNQRWIEAERQIHSGLCEAVIQGQADAAVEWLQRHYDLEKEIIETYYRQQ